MNISDVAKITGLTSKAIRFYEEKGLSDAADAQRKRLSHLHAAASQRTDLTAPGHGRWAFNTEESGELVNLFNDPQRHSADVKRRTLEKVAEIETTH